MRTAYILLFLLWMPFLSAAQNPNGYYNTASGKKKEQLKTALHTITRNHTAIDYGSVWNAFYQTDRKADGTVWDMYSNIVRNFSNTSGMNREHSLPKSWWGGDENPAYTDLNHLFPSDADANTAKLNYPLGVVGSATFSNGVSKVGSNIYPGYTGMVFEPANQYKGDFARAYFYMVTCYQDFYNKWKYFYMMDGNTYPVFKSWAVSMLLDWHRNDPVSDKERARNEAVFKIQNNRNPFIDYPDLVEHIWGNKTEVAFTINTQITEPVLATPTNDTKLDFGTVLKNASNTKSLFVKGYNLSGNLTVLLYGANKDMYKVSVTTISSASANTEAGFELKVTYSPTAVATTHTASIIIYDGGIEGSVMVNITGKCIDPSVVSSPVATSATYVTTSSFTANWQAVPSADGYLLNVYKGTPASPVAVVTDEDVAGLSFDLVDLEMGADYYYNVKAVFGSYVSQPSNNVLVATATSLEEGLAGKGVSCWVDEGTVWIKTTDAAPMQIVATNLQGQRVALLRPSGNVCSLQLPQGVYFVDVDGQIHKVVVGR